MTDLPNWSTKIRSIRRDSADLSRNQIKIHGFCLVQLNTCMTRKHAKRPKRPRTFKQKTAMITEGWLKSVHIMPRFLSDTSIDTEFLMAQREAESLLRNFAKYLSDSDSYQLVNFLRRLRSRQHRDVLPISLAHKVLNITTRVNRQCFRDYRALKKQEKQQDKPLANKG
jgi:hypothetical protein